MAINGWLDDEIYMKQPEGFASPGQQNLVCKLKRSLYGLKQSPRCWNEVLHEQLVDMFSLLPISVSTSVKSAGVWFLWRSTSTTFS